ncbi:glycosyltransferase family 2 protein [Clostridium estertheticum]|uniref:glycosyltransferase family 2 protein n=1 Tax=Clostridium estertheticum TaxID=238834 RepID=UPI001C6E5A8C|nr:glycosyltransferase [Clostridium estertheticum]MBW9152826.1 glycosyltransferase [Clostridium estertheticum]WLC85783.1 glycosyltransferase [Clostridium estertheticum]
MFDVSIIIPCKNELNNLKKTVESIMNSKNKLSYEIIIVDDGSTDRSCDFININKESYKDIKLISVLNFGAAGSRNFGAKTASGKYLFFCDAHVSVPDYWLDNLIKTLEDNNAHIIAPVIKDMVKENYKGYGQTWDNNLNVMWLLNKIETNGSEIPIACGCAFGIKKEVFEAIGGFDKYFEVWGKEDEELCFKSWLFGYKIILDISVEVKHLFRSKHPYLVTPENVIYNFLCMAYCHFENKNLVKALNIACKDYGFSYATAKIMLNEDLMKQRKEYLNKRKYSEDYFFKKFNIPF